jgi:hypothetical protein
LLLADFFECAGRNYRWAKFAVVGGEVFEETDETKAVF